MVFGDVDVGLFVEDGVVENNGFGFVSLLFCDGVGEDLGEGFGVDGVG